MTALFQLNCKNPNHRHSNKSFESQSDSTRDSITYHSTERVVFYIENSGSVAPYLHSIDSELKTTLLELTQIPHFRDIPKSYYFIDGKSIQYIGNDLSSLKRNLIPQNFQAPTSDLNETFRMVLDSVPNQISVLLTDGLYDISDKSDVDCYIEKPDERLTRETVLLRSLFNQRISDTEFHTILLKAISSFSGSYYYATKPGVCSVRIDQNRPYYYFLFGESNILNLKSFRSYLEKMNHVKELASFKKLSDTDNKLSIELSHYRPNQTRGSYTICREELNCLNGIKTDRSGQGFDFKFKADFSHFHWFNSIIESIDAYELSNSNFYISDVSSISESQFTHEITVSSDSKNIYDRNLEISLSSCYLPGWIIDSSSTDETFIVDDTSTTWGLEMIMTAIGESYCVENQNQIAKLNFKLKK
ncbi:MAG: hypothetical protein OXE55_00220 [Flavobacteriaceae bacterium]|nr:hypothetical protein [Flavobacteriaceae bacterium]